MEGKYPFPGEHGYLETVIIIKLYVTSLRTQ